MKLIVYMPAFNEEENIQTVISRLPTSLPQVDCIQVLVIDDGSRDQTAALAKAAGAVVVSHGRNRGVGAAFHSAVQFALEQDADILVGIDADGQFDSAEIAPLIAPILAGTANMVVGNRFDNGQPADMPRVKYWGNMQVSRLVGSICGQRFTDVSCGFRAYDREALLRLNIFGHFTYTHETILALVYQGLRVIELPVHVTYYPERKSRVAGSIPNYALQTSKIILRVLLDYRPLRIFGALGGVLIGLGALCELFLLGYYVINSSFTPYKNIGFIGLGFVIFGMLVLLIALIADMLNRVRLNQDRLLYELKKTRYGR